MGAKLLHRTTRRLTLTPAGEAWLERCVAALGELDRGENALLLARDTPGGEVRIDLPTAFGRLYIMPVLLDVAKRYPALNLNVSFTDRRVDLIGENIDLAVRIGKLEDTADLVALRIGVQHMVIVGAPGYLEQRGVPRSWDDLHAHDCIVGRRQGSRVAWLLKQADGSIARQFIPIKHEFQDFETVLMAVRAGHGLTQLPSWMVRDDVRKGTLRTVLEGWSGGELPINILWPHMKTLPAKMRVVVDGLARWARESSPSAP
ncbi:LysR substrate-binding domain-containing protein [Achromobacter aloeverae]|uniref:LysR substrate-binding domain-containing protein n=1 Tax=Achromobacter aloeverae TaxID=1750518 RepID=UPI001F0160A6|nr:LysR substrate-binding domain-containing protein [Achromobacter aloeverae]